MAHHEAAHLSPERGRRGWAEPSGLRAPGPPRRPGDGSNRRRHLPSPPPPLRRAHCAGAGRPPRHMITEGAGRGEDGTEPSVLRKELGKEDPTILSVSTDRHLPQKLILSIPDISPAESATSEAADAFRAVGKCLEMLWKRSGNRPVLVEVSHTHTRVALRPGPPARQEAPVAPRPSRPAARGRPQRRTAHALSRPFRRGAQARRVAAHARGAGWRWPRGINMEDEEVAESWEEAADSGEIDRRLEKKLKITQKESRKSKSPPKVPIVIQDDSLTAGPPPQIRILKRPTTNGVLSNPHSASRPAFPVKSLAQREAEYAEARKRILGSASPEEEQEKPILDRPPRLSQPEDTRQPNNVIRQPLGPDGSQGFKQRR
ncbi:SUZ domain-containing protein 1 [Caloenas nicobarica]